MQVVNRLVACFHSGILLGLFDPEDVCDMFLRNVGWLSTDCTAIFQNIELFAKNINYHKSKIVFPLSQLKC
jgi:hypothetical protein